MKNEIQTIISLIRANPSYARVAITLDAFVGMIFGVLVFVGLNATVAELTSSLVLSFASAIALVAIAFAGYTLLFRAGAEIEYYYEEDEDEE